MPFKIKLTAKQMTDLEFWSKTYKGGKYKTAIEGYVDDLYYNQNELMRNVANIALSMFYEAFLGDISE